MRTQGQGGCRQLSKSTAAINEDVTLMIAASTGETPTAAVWDFGDSAAGTGATVTHRWATARTYQVSVRATIANGTVGTASVSITVTPPPTLPAPAQLAPADNTRFNQVWPRRVTLTWLGVGVVPYIASWTAEQTVDLTVIERRGVGIGYLGETVWDRDEHGVLWRQLSSKQGHGRPEFGKVHPLRQRRAQVRQLCGICAGPADRNEQGVLWLVRDFRDDWGGQKAWPSRNHRFARHALGSRSGFALRSGKGSSPSGQATPGSPVCAASSIGPESRTRPSARGHRGA